MPDPAKDEEKAAPSSDADDEGWDAPSSGSASRAVDEPSTVATDAPSIDPSVPSPVSSLPAAPTTKVSPAAESTPDLPPPSLVSAKAASVPRLASPAPASAGEPVKAASSAADDDADTDDRDTESPPRMRSSIPDDYDGAATNVMEAGVGRPVAPGTPLSFPAVPAAPPVPSSARLRAAEKPKKDASSGSAPVVAAAEPLPRLYDEDAATDDGPTTVGAAHGFEAPPDLDVGRKGPAPAVDVRDADTLSARHDMLATDRQGRRVDPDDETAALPLDMLVRPREGHVVFGSDAVGDEATIAAPASIDASTRARAMASLGIRPDDPGTAPAPFPPVDLGAPRAGAPPAFPAIGARSPAAMPAAREWGGTPNAPAAPFAPPPFASPGPPMGAQAPLAHAPRPPAPAPAPWQQAGSPSPKFSSQIILLVVVGVVCLGIFATGIYLFVTTKF